MRLPVFLTVWTIACWLGCGGPTTNIAFQQSDPAFRPAPGAKPRVYLEGDEAEIPKVPMRSVGLVVLSVPEGSGIAGGLELARQKGQQLGCWILVEHSVFVSLHSAQSRVELAYGATIVLVHATGGGVGHAKEPKTEGQISAELDCVLQTTLPSSGLSADVIGSGRAPR